MSDNHRGLTRRDLLVGVGAICLLSVSKVGQAAGGDIIAVRLWPSSTYTRLTLESTATLVYKQFVLTQPARLVIDIANIRVNRVMEQAANLVRRNDPYIKQLRVGQFNSNTVRIVLELKQPVAPHLFTLAPVATIKYRLVVDLFPDDASDGNDPLLALLKEYDRGNLRQSQPAAAPLPGKAGSDRPMIIMIDPGHGGEDPGARGPRGTCEKDIVLKIARYLKQLLTKQPNMRVYMTRNEDVFIPLQVRVAKARNQRADLFISIHADAFTNRAAHGASVFALSTKGATSAAARFLAQSQNAADLIGGVSLRGDRYLDHTLFDMVQSRTIDDSLRFGAAVLKQMGNINSLHKANVDQAGFAVLKAPDIPSILVETAFISNVAEERKLSTTKYQKQVAMAIYSGINAWIKNSGRR